MTATADLKAITPTNTAKANAQKAGVELSALHVQLLVLLSEVQIMLKRIQAVTPGGDANMTALNNLLAELI